jgi:hypothetical protein
MGNEKRGTRADSPLTTIVCSMKGKRRPRMAIGTQAELDLKMGGRLLFRKSFAVRDSGGIFSVAERAEEVEVVDVDERRIRGKRLPVLPAHGSNPPFDQERN